MFTEDIVFDNTGFVYDIDNPTKQTEELSYILKNFLLELGLQGFSVSWPEREEAETLYTSATESIDILAGAVDAMQMTLYDIEIRLQNLQKNLTEEQIWSEELPGLVDSFRVILQKAMQDIAAMSGLTIDNPGAAIFRQSIPPEEP